MLVYPPLCSQSLTQSWHAMMLYAKNSRADHDFLGAVRADVAWRSSMEPPNVSRGPMSAWM